jgi:hypothetical protein
MDFYDSKDSYSNGSNRISRISLKYMKITTDPKYFNPDTPQVEACSLRSLSPLSFSPPHTAL